MHYLVKNMHFNCPLKITALTDCLNCHFYKQNVLFSGAKGALRIISMVPSKFHVMAVLKYLQSVVKYVVHSKTIKIDMHSVQSYMYILGLL